MIDLYYWPTPNGWKVSILLEELGVPYEVKYVNIGKGEQFEPDFLKISPNNRMPAIVDHRGPEPVSVFESGAIMIYLAQEDGRFYPSTDASKQAKVNEWLFWQMGGLGPMAGQLSHFVNYAPKEVDHTYSHNRYANEYDRLLGVMNTVLDEREYLAGDYSIADMACWGWVLPYKRFGQSLDHLPNVERWYEALRARPAVQKGFEVGKDFVNRNPRNDEEARKILFGQTAKTVAKKDS